MIFSKGQFTVENLVVLWKKEEELRACRVDVLYVSKELSAEHQQAVQVRDRFPMW